MMFIEGKIKKYDAEQGCGLIQAEDQQHEIFFQVADFPTQDGEPKEGEKLKFVLLEDQGRLKAIHIIRAKGKRSSSTPKHVVMPSSSAQATAKHRTGSHKKGIVLTMLGILGVVVLMGLVFQKYQAYQQSQQLKAAQLVEEQKKIVEQQRKTQGYIPEIRKSEKTQPNLKLQPTSLVLETELEQPMASQAQFKCDGRQYCSQMRSYEEAVFFLRNCLDTKLDGNQDGQPCENDSRWK